MEFGILGAVSLESKSDEVQVIQLLPSHDGIRSNLRTLGGELLKNSPNSSQQAWLYHCVCRRNRQTVRTLLGHLSDSIPGPRRKGHQMMLVEAMLAG
jgi:hypothetical protein